MRDAVRMCLWLATLASAHASNRTIQDLCNGDPVCIREEQFFEKERLKNGGDSSPVVTAGVGCVVAFSILAFCIKLYHESRTGEGSESW